MYNPVNDTHVKMFEAGQAYDCKLLCISTLISRLPEEIRHKFTDLTLGDLTVLKIADKLEIYRNRHLKANAKLQIQATMEEDSSLDKEELLFKAVAGKKVDTQEKRVPEVQPEFLPATRKDRTNPATLGPTRKGHSAWRSRGLE